MLIEEGKIALDDPVAKYLPEFAGKPTLTIRHCIAHLGGFPFEMPGALEKGGWNHRGSIREVARDAAKLPLAFEPGGTIGYSNVGVDICAAVVEVVSGQPWEKFVEERIIRPLGMRDTTFRPTEEQLSRRLELATVKRGEKAAMRKEVTPRDWMQPPFNGETVFPSAGAGLWSTARDQLKFFRMLMNLGMGENGVRILKEDTVKRYFAQTIRPEGLGCYGLGVAAPLKDTPGGWYGMGGAWGTDCSVNYHTKSLKLWVVQFLGDRNGWDDVRHEAEERFFAQTIDDSSVKAYTGRLK